MNNSEKQKRKKRTAFGIITCGIWLALLIFGGFINSKIGDLAYSMVTSVAIIMMIVTLFVLYRGRQKDAQKNNNRPILRVGLWPALIAAIVILLLGIYVAFST